MAADLRLENRPIALALGEIPSCAAHIIPSRVVNPGASYLAIWPKATAYPWLAAAEVLQVVSTSANDNAAGSGARTVYVAGLLADYTEAEETLTLHASDGTIAVSTARTWLRIRKFSVLTAGATGANEGTLSLRRVGTPTDVLGHIAIGDSHCLQAVATVPAGKKGLLFDPHISFNNTASVRVRVREFGGVWQSRSYFEGFVFSGGPGALVIPRVYGAKADIMLQATATAANIAADFALVYVPTS